MNHASFVFESSATRIRRRAASVLGLDPGGRVQKLGPEASRLCQGFERRVLFAIDEETAEINRRLKETLDE